MAGRHTAAGATEYALYLPKQKMATMTGPVKRMKAKIPCRVHRKHLVQA
jgi:hypothetical protein